MRFNGDVLPRVCQRETKPRSIPVLPTAMRYPQGKLEGFKFDKLHNGDRLGVGLGEQEHNGAVDYPERYQRLPF